MTGVKSAREEFDYQCERLTQEASEKTLQFMAKLWRGMKIEVANFDTTIKKALSRADLGDIGPDMSEYISGDNAHG